jgi:hypothetical protein
VPPAIVARIQVAVNTVLDELFNRGLDPLGPATCRLP